MHVINQAHAAGTCLVSLSANVGMCVCLSPRLLITSGMIWTPYDWFNKFYGCCMATVVDIFDECGLGIDMCCGN